MLERIDNITSNLVDLVLTAFACVKNFFSVNHRYVHSHTDYINIYDNNGINSNNNRHISKITASEAKIVLMLALV